MPRAERERLTCWIIGGIGTIEDPIVGTLVFFVLRELLGDYGTWYLIVLGAVAIAVMLVAPRGLRGAVEARFDLRLFPVQRRVVLEGHDTGRRRAPGPCRWRP